MVNTKALSKSDSNNVIKSSGKIPTTSATKTSSNSTTAAQPSRVSSANFTNHKKNYNNRSNNINNNNNNSNNNNKKRTVIVNNSSSSGGGGERVNVVMATVINKIESVTPTSSTTTQLPPQVQDKNLNRSESNNGILPKISSYYGQCGSICTSGGGSGGVSDDTCNINENSHNDKNCVKCLERNNSAYPPLNTTNNNKYSNSIKRQNSQNNKKWNYGKNNSTSGGGNCNNTTQKTTKFVPIEAPSRPILSSTSIAGVISDQETITLLEKYGKRRFSYPLMQSGTIEVSDTYHLERRTNMDSLQIDDGFHSDGGTETPPLSPSSGNSVISVSDHGSLENIDSPGAQRLAVLSFEQVRKLNDVMNETVCIHGRGNFPILEVKLKDLVTLFRKKLETDVQSGGAGMVVKDVRLNGGAASHVLATEDQQYNDLDLIYAVEISSNRHFDRIKSAVLNTLLDLLPDGVSKRRIMPCSLKEAYVGKMVKVNNNNDGDRWSLISLGNSPGHKNVELKFVDTMRRQFEFSVDSFQILLDSLLIFYDCAALPISENFYPTVVGESIYGDFQEALYHLKNKLISTRQPEEIRGGGLLKYCNLLVRNYKPVNLDKIKTLERYMCSRFFIDFPEISTQTVKLEAYLRNHFWGADEEPLQYQYLMHLRGVVESSTVCLMGHERRQTLHLIQSLAMSVLCREQHKQQAVKDSMLQQQHQQMQQGIENLQFVDQQQQQQQSQQLQKTSTSIAQGQSTLATTTSPSASTSSAASTCCQQQQQQQQQTQTIQIQSGPPGLIYANGVYYAPVIPTTICTCNSTWLSA